MAHDGTLVLLWILIAADVGSWLLEKTGSSCSSMHSIYS